jgi:GMP synthase-like glutamine amidotransferase
LMSGRTYPNQAFRVGAKAWGIQFHVEADADMLAWWADLNADDLAADGRDAAAILERTLPELAEVQEVWGEVLRRFARLVPGS